MQNNKNNAIKLTILTGKPSIIITGELEENFNHEMDADVHSQYLTEYESDPDDYSASQRAMQRRGNATDDEDNGITNGGEDYAVRTGRGASTRFDDVLDSLGGAPEEYYDEQVSYFDEIEVIGGEMELPVLGENENNFCGREAGVVMQRSEEEVKKKEKEKEVEEEALAVPRFGEYYMHDDRFGSRGGRRSYDRRSYREFKDEGKWQHDKFNEVAEQDKVGNAYDDCRQGYYNNQGRVHGCVKANEFKLSNSYKNKNGRAVRGTGPVKYKSPESRDNVYPPTSDKSLGITSSGESERALSCVSKSPVSWPTYGAESPHLWHLPLSEMLTHLSVTSSSQVNIVSPMIQHHFTQQWVHGNRIQPPLQVYTPQCSDSGIGSQVSYEAILPSALNIGVVESFAGSYGSEFFLAGQGSGTIQYHVLGSPCGESHEYQNFPPTTPHLPGMQSTVQHPGADLSRYITHPEVGFGNSGIARLPFVTGGLDDASHPPNATPTSSYYACSPGHVSSVGIASGQAGLGNPSKHNKSSERAEVVNNKYGQQRIKPQRFSKMKF